MLFANIAVRAYASRALRIHVNTSLSRPPDRTWRCPAGRPGNNSSTNPEMIPLVPVETSGGVCRPWTRWCNDATAVAGYAAVMDDGDDEFVRC